MGCGKSKHDVASDSTVLQRKKSSVSSKAGQENVTETKDQNNNNVENVSSGVEVDQKESESVKESGVEVNNNVKDEQAEKTNVQEEKDAEGEKDDSLKENDQKTNDAIDDTVAAAAEEEKPAENEKEDIIVKEESLAKEAEEIIEDTYVSTSEGEEKDLKVEEGQ